MNITLWNIIRDWFVQYVFGGQTSTGQNYYLNCGQLVSYDNGSWDESVNGVLNDLVFVVSKSPSGYETTIGLSDWLSTTATLIVLIAVCVGLFFLVRYFFRMFAGLLSGR